MLQLEVLVLELVPIDGFPTRSVAVREITALDHKLLDDTMESRALVAEAFFTGRQGPEVFHGLVIL